jgi:bifunctional ADP-heptose synthase (sugar kinase/adenylyltransferase)
VPDILIKGADWSNFIVGREEVEAAGGQVVTAPLRMEYSTTRILEKLLTLEP